MRCFGAFLAFVWAAAHTVPVQAHHSFAAEFDAGKTGEISGTITGVWFNNPHVRYQLETRAEDGSVQSWELQASSVTSLQQAGWTAQTLEVGDQVTVGGQFGRNGAQKLFLRTVERPDGTQIATGRGERSGPDPNVVDADPKKRYGYGEVRAQRPVDITGPWRNSYKFRVTVDDLEPKPTPFTAAGKQFAESLEHWDDPALRCLALGLPRLFGSPYNMEIVDAGTHYLFVHVEHNTPRRVWMDGRTLAPSTPPTSLGFSVGRWEGDVLVIETTNLLPGWLDGSGLPMSGEGTRIVERWDVAADKLSIDRTMTIYDPYYTQPLVRVRGSARGDAIDISEQSSCDPNSYYRDLRENGRLDAHLDR